MNNQILQNNIRTYEEFLHCLRKAFGCENSFPGSTRVTCIKYDLPLFFLSFYCSFFSSYERQTTIRKVVGEWIGKSLGLYYAFTMVDDTLFAAKAFSNVGEDWVSVEYSEIEKEIEIVAAVTPVMDIPGVNTVAIGRNTLLSSLQRENWYRE